VLNQISGQLGTFREVRGESNPYTLVFSEGTATAIVQLSEEDALSGIRFTQIVPAAGSLDEAVAKFRELPGGVAFLVTENGRAIASENEDRALAVGSSFKLAVLAAVQEAVAEGELAWDTVVGLKEAWRSLPSGLLQNWPIGSAVTIETLATLMIAQSDNTATDALIRTVGRQKVEEYAPSSRPLLTTREAFVLKDPANAALTEEFLRASIARKREILDRSGPDSIASRDLPGADLFTGGPVSPQVEWFFSAAELCNLIDELAPLDLSTVNPGVAAEEQWERISYKGGSEPGVLNMTTRLVAEDGTVYCVSATQNRDDEDLDHTAFIAAYQGVLGALH
jgi:beta-lactamase class A